MNEPAHEYAKLSLENELKRFDSLDSKATKFLSFVSVMFGLLISVVTTGFSTFFPPVTKIQCLIVFMLFLLSFSLILSWFYLFRAIKVSDRPVLKLNDDVVSFFYSKETDTDFCVVKSYSDLMQAHKKEMKKKEHLIECAYTCIFNAGVIFVPTLFFILISKL
ncbi:hypothetical protein MW652_001136 [Vibrio vulnificus]|nr:hypothetical protein [Vibrio vulnificus]EJB5282215.1 hypothetical protein [Vibrio vulnificus]HAS8226492.1 hypothetical protein [Vibrio vulnificus]HAS8503605.1 hypothetical protein [Vibrio vulnificus]HAS8523303.1 hypothetical protein [Vibrio vulnificus]